MLSHGAKSGVRASSATDTQPVPTIARTSPATPAHDSRAHRHSATAPPPASAAAAGASALT